MARKSQSSTVAAQHSSSGVCAVLDELAQIVCSIGLTNDTVVLADMRSKLQVDVVVACVVVLVGPLALLRAI